MKQYSPVVYYIALSMAVLVWGSSFPVLKIALSEYTPAQVLAGRMLTASVLCLPVLRPLLRKLKDRKTLWILLFAVLCEPCVYFLMEGYAVRYTTASQAGMVIAAMPLTVAVGAWIFLKEKLSALGWTGFVLSITGVIALSLGAEASASAPNPLLGNTLEFLAAICGAVYTLSAKYLSRRLAPIELTGAMSYAGALFFSSLCLLPQTLPPIPLEVSVPSWMPEASILFLGSVVMLVGYGLYNFALCGMPAGRVAAFMNLVPVCSLFMGVFFLHDHMSLLQYGAAGLIILGVVLTQQGGRREKDA